MRPQIHDIQNYFRWFNAEIFGSELPEIPIVLTRARGYMGKLTYRIHRRIFGRAKYADFGLRISIACDLPEEEYQDTVIHEMIHYYILLHGIRDTSAHGTYFRGMMADINRRHGRHVTVSHRLTGEDRAAMPVRASIVCLMHMRDGRTLFFVSSRTRIFDLDRTIRAIGDIASHVWLYSTQPFFSSYPRVRTLKGYFAPPETLDPILAECRVIEMTDTAARLTYRTFTPDMLQ